MVPGMLVEGEWRVEERRGDEEGRFIRSGTTSRDFVTADDSSGFRAEAGRYHLYISWACPWAHRTAILRKLKGLEDVVGLAAVGSFMGDDGLTFYDEPGVSPIPSTARAGSALPARGLPESRPQLHWSCHYPRSLG